jgi:YHS domain-containing protein
VLANRIMQNIIRPRMKKLVEQFPNAAFPDDLQAPNHHSVCRFESNECFPATAQLELAVTHDGDYETVLYELEILPVFFSFKTKDQLAFPRTKADEERVAAWVDDRLFEFVETYLRLEVLRQYQGDNVAADPVCGMTVNKGLAPVRLERGLQTYYFCRDKCRQKFAANPERYLNPIKQGHSS